MDEARYKPGDLVMVDRDKLLEQGIDMVDELIEELEAHGVLWVVRQLGYSAKTAEYPEQLCYTCEALSDRTEYDWYEDELADKE